MKSQQEAPRERHLARRVGLAPYKLSKQFVLPGNHIGPLLVYIIGTLMECVLRKERYAPLTQMTTRGQIGDYSRGRLVKHSW